MMWSKSESESRLRAVSPPLSSSCLALAVAAASLLGGCGMARVVQRSQVGGVLALQGTRQEATKDAHVKMAAHCGPGQYTVLSEGEQVVGSQTSNSEEAKKTKKGAVVSQGSSQTLDVTEWRITYQCGAAPVATYPGYAAPAGYPPPPPGYPAPAGYPPAPPGAPAAGAPPAGPPAYPAGYPPPAAPPATGQPPPGYGPPPPPYPPPAGYGPPPAQPAPAVYYPPPAPAPAAQRKP